MINLKLHQLNNFQWSRLTALSEILVPMPPEGCLTCNNTSGIIVLRRQLMLANYASQLYDLCEIEKEKLIESWEINLVA